MLPGSEYLADLAERSDPPIHGRFVTALSGQQTVCFRPKCGRQTVFPALIFSALKPGGKDGARDRGRFGRGAGHAREMHGPVAVVRIMAVRREPVRREAANDRDHRESRDDREDAVAQE